MMRIEIDGLEEFAQRLERIAENAEHMDEPLQRTARILSRSTATTFDAQGRPRWRRRADNKPHPILDKTGRMRDSVESLDNYGDSVCRVETSPQVSFVEIGTRVEYADYHQHAGRDYASPPKRPFLKIYPEDATSITKEVRSHLLEEEIS